MKHENILIANAVKARIKESVGINVAEVSRLREIVNFRMAFADQCRNRLGISYGNIGLILDKEHCSVIHYVKQSSNLKDTKDPEYLAVFEEVNNCFTSVIDSTDWIATNQIHRIQITSLVREYILSNEIKGRQRKDLLAVLTKTIKSI